MQLELDGVAVAGTFGPGAEMTCYLEKRADGWWIRVEEGARCAWVGRWSDAAAAAEAAQAVVVARRYGGRSFDQVMAWGRDTVIE